LGESEHQGLIMEQCQAKTKKGKRCRNMALAASQYCYRHQKDADEQSHAEPTLVSSKESFEKALWGRYFSNIPLTALVAANAIPLFGVIFLGWDAFLIVLLYWAENLVVGFYNILKMALAAAPPQRGMPRAAAHLGKLFLIPFMFKNTEDKFMEGADWPCFLVFLQMLLNVIKRAYSAIPANMKFALLALFISHGVSFVYNYLLKREFATMKLEKQMMMPYARIFVMHIAIIAGGILVGALGSPAALLFVLVVLKTILDAALHLLEHRKKTQMKPSR
jgi:uncharacterized protein YjfI (DUF2170 family)